MVEETRITLLRSTTDLLPDDAENVSSVLSGGKVVRRHIVNQELMMLHGHDVSQVCLRYVNFKSIWYKT